MKAVLTAERPSGDGWVFERKLDGIRCLAVKDRGRVKLYSRNELSLNDRYPGIADALDAEELAGLVEEHGNRVILTRAGRLLANEVALRLR